LADLRGDRCWVDAPRREDGPSRLGLREPEAAVPLIAELALGRSCEELRNSPAKQIGTSRSLNEGQGVELGDHRRGRLEREGCCLAASGVQSCLHVGASTRLAAPDPVDGVS
jgi:hypothetical protein